MDEGQTVKSNIDFLPSLSEEKIFKFIKKQMSADKDVNAGGSNNKTIEECLNGLLNKKITVFILKEAKIPSGKALSALSDKEIKLILKLIKSFEATVTGSKSFDMAQVCSGGVDTTQVDSRTMQSKKTKGLYFVGELLDVDGICGGYNLQWAWTSGYLAGKNAAGALM